MTTRTAGGIGSGLFPAVSFAPRGADDPIHLFVGQLRCAGLCRSRQVPHHIEEFAFHGFILAVAHNDKKSEFAGKLGLFVFWYLLRFKKAASDRESADWAAL